MKKTTIFSTRKMYFLAFFFVGFLLFGCKKEIEKDQSKYKEQLVLQQPADASRTAGSVIIDANFYASTTKKGMACTNDNATVNMGLVWNYNWGASRSLASLQNTAFLPMIWGASSASPTNLSALKMRIINGDAAKIVLSFNEPDNRKQSAIWAKDAIPLYQTCYNTLNSISGMYFASPVMQEMSNLSGAGNPSVKWLDSFMNVNGALVDRIAVHWYDWGAAPSTESTYSGWTDSELDNLALGIAGRLETYLNQVYARYGKYIFVTEFNANVRRKNDKLQKYFMYHATKKMDALAFVSRYSFFFETTFPGWSTDGTLTSVGNEWKNR